MLDEGEGFFRLIGPSPRSSSTEQVLGQARLPDHRRQIVRPDVLVTMTADRHEPDQSAYRPFVLVMAAPGAVQNEAVLDENIDEIPVLHTALGSMISARVLKPSPSLKKRSRAACQRNFSRSDKGARRENRRSWSDSGNSLTDST